MIATRSERFLQCVRRARPAPFSPRSVSSLPRPRIGRARARGHGRAWPRAFAIRRPERCRLAGRRSPWTRRSRSPSRRRSRSCARGVRGRDTSLNRSSSSRTVRMSSCSPPSGDGAGKNYGWQDIQESGVDEDNLGDHAESATSQRSLRLTYQHSNVINVLSDPSAGAGALAAGKPGWPPPWSPVA